MLDQLVAELCPSASARPTLEDVLTSPEWMGLTEATPMQRAICRIADGRPLAELLELPLVEGLEAYDEDIQERCRWEWCIGDVDALPDEPPAEIDLVAGIRGGKSLFAAASAIHAGVTADLDGIRLEGEPPRYPIVGTTKDIGGAIYGHVTGAAKTSPQIKRMLVGEPTKEQITLRHPSGRTIEVRIAAGSRAGSALVSRWLVGGAFDEAPRMHPAEENVVNLEEQLTAIEGRVLPGGTILCVGSPWAPLGKMHQNVEKHWQRPTAELVVIRAPGPVLNPRWWTPERCRRLKRKNLEAYRRDVLGEFGAIESSAFLDSELRAVTRTELERPPEHGAYYYAEMDPATRGNGWALVVGGLVDGKRTVVLAREWRAEDGGALEPLTVLREIADVLRPYGVRAVGTDQWAADAIITLGRQVGLSVVDEAITGPGKVDDLDSARALVRTGVVELPPDPLLQADMRRVKRRLTQAGVQVVFPKTADGRHCDFAGPLLKLLARAPWAKPEERKREAPPDWASNEWQRVQRLEEERRAARHEEEHGWAPSMRRGATIRRPA